MADRIVTQDAELDPLEGDARLAPYFAEAFPAVRAFRDLLVSEGVLRGLIGPQELSRLWERHLLNSAAVVPFLPRTGTIADVGSGAGLPGVVVAAALPDAHVVLVEPMERRVAWLSEVVDELGLANVTVVRARAEDRHSVRDVDAVTARAVARLDKLARWCIPLLRLGGALVALKGRSAAEELESAGPVLRRLGASPGEVLDAPTIPGVDSTTVVRVVRETVR